MPPPTKRPPAPAAHGWWVQPRAAPVQLLAAANLCPCSSPHTCTHPRPPTGLLAAAIFNTSIVFTHWGRTDLAHASGTAYGVDNYTK